MGWNGGGGGGLNSNVAGATDGQYLQYSASQGLWVPVTLPAAPGELSSGKNNTGVATTIGVNGSADIPGLTLSIPATTKDVIIRAVLPIQQTVVGQGLVVAGIYETTGGGNVFVQNFYMFLSNSTGSGSKFIPVFGEYALGPVASTRTFKVTASLVNDTGSLATVSVLNGVSSAVSYVEAVAQ